MPQWMLVPGLLLLLYGSAFAQGSIFGTVQNADLSNPGVGDLYWVGFLDDTDEEIRIESNTGGGYDGTNWFDDFQNYTTEASGNPYDYFFVNITNGEGFHLAKLIPSNSFQQEDVLLAAAVFPSRPGGLATSVASLSAVNLSWTFQSGVTYHVYRRATSNNSVFLRIDDPTGSLSNAGVPDSFFVDATANGVTDYTYLIIGEDASGNYSAHSVEIAAASSIPTAPTVIAVVPSSGSATGQPLVTVSGTNFDIAGATVTFGGVAAINITMVSPFELTCNVPTGTAGAVDVVVTNTAVSLASAPLVGGFLYLGNAAPALAAIGAQSVDEGQNLNFGISAVDADADSVILTAENVPANAAFNDNFDGTGTLDFNPDFTQSGVYNVRFIASDGSSADTEIVAITVNHVNLVPVLAAIGAQSVGEGLNLNLGVSAADPDGDSLILSAVNVPMNATFTDNFDGTGTFDFNPDFTQAGVFNVTFISSDGVLADTEVVAITVNEVNLPPALTAIGAQLVNEGANLNFGTSGSDPDGDSVILTAVGVPANATYTDNFDGTGTFDFNPDFTQAGVYNVTFIVSDGALADTEIVAITVDNVNLAPTLAAVGPQSVDEGASLNLGLSATDPELDSLILSAVNVPANATFTDNFDGTGTFDFSPDFTQAGLFNVTFIASDGVLADTEVVAITVNQVNLAPVLAAIGSQLVTEGANLNVGISAADADLDSIILSAENLPVNATFTDNFDGTGTLDFNPDFTQAGVYNVTVIASDGILADTEIVAVTVNDAGNQAPVLAAIGGQSATEGLNLNFGVSASDADLDSLILSAVNVPANATFTDNFDGTGTFDFNPDFTQAGVYNVTFIASDGGGLADTEIVAVTVIDAGNQAPVLAAIGAQVVTEGLNLNVGISASDPDLDSLILSAVNVPANATFTDNFDGTGTFDFNPDFTQAGVYNVTFITTDGALADTEIVAITVNDAGNQVPVLAAIGAQVVTEGLNLNVGVSASDPDLDSLILSAVNLPVNATFTDNFDGTGTFDFNPDFTQAGVYNVTIIASDGGGLADTEIVAITVNDAGNQIPVLAAIGTQVVTEGLNLNVGISASDADLDSLILSAVNLPVNATFTDNFDGTGTFDFNPGFTQAGIYNITFIASDGGGLADTEIVAVTVNEAGNQVPVLAAIGAQLVNEGANLNFGISAGDADLDSLILSAVNLPANATFTDNFDGTGTFDFNPDFTQAGVFNVTFIASDGGGLADTEIVAITVNDAGNQLPVLAAIGSQSVTEGLNLNFGISASDADLDSLILSAVNVPANATFTDNFDGTGTFDFNPDFTQAGVYNVTFIASDGGGLADTEIVAVTVLGAGNQVPVLAAIGAQVVTEGLNLNFGVSATDADLDSIILTAVNLPVNAVFSDNFDGTGTLDFNPDFTQAGVYNVTFVASDGALADTEIVAITVNDAGNQVPVLAAIGAQAVDEGQNLNFGISASDADLDSLILSAVNLPVNATFTDNFDGTGMFDFNPDFTQSGVYNVTFVASDGGGLADTEIVAITVNHVNLAPVLNAIGPQGVDEGQNLNLVVSGSDPDLDSLILSVVGLPVNATFTDNFDGTGTFEFNPDFTQSGLYNVTVIIADGALADTEVVAITVNHVNLAPVASPVGSPVLTEGQSLSLSVSATDFDGDSLIWTAENVPVNATFSDNFDGTGNFDFSPDFTQAGVYNVTFIASDGALADTVIMTITVDEAGNQAPVLAAIGSKVVVEGQTLAFNVSATDADGTIPALSAQNVPVNASFADSGDGTGLFEFTPSFTQAGTYFVVFIASDGALADTEFVGITVLEAGNQPPVVDPIAPQVMDEGQNLLFGVIATDPENAPLTLTATNVPLNATFVDSGNGSGSLEFDPDFMQAGVYNISVIAFDGALADTEIAVITVNHVNLAPVLAAIGSQFVDEGQNLNVGVTASDFDGDSLIFSAQNLPLNAMFADNFDGTGTLDFNPDFTQSGVYNVTIIVSDGPLADTEVVAITVTHVNLAPAWAVIGPQLATEGLNLNVPVSASDADLDSLTLSAENLPANATFTDNFDGTGVFDFNPDFAQAGVYNVTFIVSDGVLADTEIVAVTVGDAGNQAPVLAAIGAQAASEGQNLNFGVSGSDPDGDSLIFSAQNLPANATLTDNFDGTGTLDFTPDFSQAGTYNVSFIVSDGALADTEVVVITVSNVNRGPFWIAIGAKFVDEGQNLNFDVGAGDLDGDSLILTVENLPANATFIDSYDWAGTFDFNPDSTQAGVYNVRFIVSDGALADTEIVVITVNGVNLAPVLAPIGPQIVDEGQNLNLIASATDFDLDSIILTAENLPANATFTDNFDGSGSFVFDPDFTQSGVYNVTVIASDGALADTEIVAITVNEVNRSPVWTPIGAQLVAEGQNLNLGVLAGDADSDSLILTAINLPVNATFVDNFDGSGTFDFNPDFTQSGVYNVTFVASDGALADTEIVAITVNELGNQRPILIPLSDTIIDENTLLSIPVLATEPDGDSLILTAVNLPVNAAFTDNFNGTGALDFSPSYFQAGIYLVSVIASDGLLADTVIVQITVNNVNQVPVLNPIGPLAMLEGDTLSLLVSAFDGDSVIPSLVVDSLPVGAVFTDSANGTGLLVFVAGFNQAGVYQLIFIASDGVDADSELVSLTVTEAGDQPPVLTPIGSQIVTEGDTLLIRVTATDPDVTIPVLTAMGLPPNATFVDSLNGAAGFIFAPDFNQGGIAYQVTFAASDGFTVDSEVVLITVAELGNLPPVFDSVGPQTVAEGDTLVVLVHAVDPEGTAILMGLLNPEPNAIFVDSGNGYGTLTYMPNFLQSGEDTLRILALDGAPSPATQTLAIAITVTETNLSPLMEPIGDRSVLVGDSIFIRVVASDTTAPPGSGLFLATLGAPLNSTFQDSGDGIGHFVFKPTAAQVGPHVLTFIATDDGSPALAATEMVTLTVQGQNLPPVLAPIGPKAVPEGGTLVIVVSAVDPDGTIPFLTVDTLPENATFVDSGNGVGTLTFTPNYLQSGLYNVVFTASDGLLTDDEAVLIQVQEAGNQSPQLALLPDSVSVVETNQVFILITATDPEDQALTLSVEPAIPNAVFVDSGNGVGLWEMTPDFWQDSVYTLTMIAVDALDAADTATVVLTVIDVGNQAPFFVPIDTQFVLENASLVFTVTASDTDRTVPSLTARPLPPLSSFVDNGDGTGDFTITPDFVDAGIYDVYFVAFDEEDITLTDSMLVPVVVLDQNFAPEFDSSSTSGQTVVMREGDSITIWHNAIDRDGPLPIMSIDSVPSPNMTWVDSGGGFIWITFTPDFDDRGLYNLVIKATDAVYDTAFVTRVQQFSVGSTNLAPVFDAVGPLSVLEGDTLELIVRATDPNPTIPTLTAFDIPPNGSFTPLGNGEGRFLFTPTFYQAGVYTPSFVAADFQLSDTLTVEITVVEYGNHAPEWISEIPADTVILTVFSNDTLFLEAADVDNVTLTLSAVDLPPNATFTQWTGKIAYLIVTPDSTQVDSTYTVTLIAADTALADTAQVIYHVVSFVRGDINADGVLDVFDVVLLAAIIFREAPDSVPFDVADINGDGVYDILDLVTLVDHVFRGGPPPS